MTYSHEYQVTYYRTIEVQYFLHNQGAIISSQSRCNTSDTIDMTYYPAIDMHNVWVFDEDMLQSVV